MVDYLRLIQNRRYCERIAAKIDFVYNEATGKKSKSACYIWTGAVDGFGYPCISLGGRTVLAHRFVYAATYGESLEEEEIREELNGGVIKRQCGNKLCMNPYHMETYDKREFGVFNGKHRELGEDEIRRLLEMRKRRIPLRQIEREFKIGRIKLKGYLNEHGLD